MLSLCVMLSGSGCALQLLGAPQGDLTLTASFADVVDLVQGNTVQTSNVVIGSVIHVEVENYRAKVTMSIADGHQIPVGTAAVVRRTSLLGEHFVDLVFPEGVDPATVQYLADDAEITDTDSDPEVEALAARAAEMVAALAADDVAAVVQAGAEALGGRGPQLNHLISQLAQYTTGLESQLGAIGSAIDNAAQLTAALAPLSDQFTALLDSAVSSTETLSATRDQFFTAIDQFNALTTTSGEVILSHIDAFSRLAQELDAFLGPLAQQKDVLASIFDNLASFVPKIPRAISEGQLLAAAWIDTNFQLMGLPEYLQQLLERLLGGG
ncbi:MAG: MCE family protein [Acidimicrobiales bacterium]